MLLAAVVSLVVGAGLATWLARPAAARLLLDRPNERSLHLSPTPRTGGLAVLVALAAGAGAALFTGLLNPLDAEHYPVLLAIVLALGLGVVSIADDRWGLPVSIRLTAHLAAAVVFVVQGRYVSVVPLPGIGPIDLGVFGMPLTVLGIVWMVNLYNFMDGLDGLAGGMTVIGFSAVALTAGVTGQGPLMLLGVLTAASAAGFLRYNLPKARVFLGDGGSVSLGFLAGSVTAMFGSADGQLWVPLILFAPFIVDATATLLRRMIHAEPVWKAHRGHYYQRLVLSGWPVRRVLQIEYTIMCAAAAHALWYVGAGSWGRMAVLASSAICCAWLMRAADAAVSRGKAPLSTVAT